MGAPISGDSVTANETLAAGAQIVRQVLNARGQQSFARQISVFNTGTNDLLLSYGNGALCTPIPIKANQTFTTEGPITCFVLKSTAGTTCSVELKVA